MSKKFKLPGWVLPVIIALPMLAETTAYKEKESKETAEMPEQTPTDIQEMDSEHLYLFLSKAITEKKLYLNPA